MMREGVATRLEAAIARIEADDLNAWSHLDLESAREAARVCDQRVMRDQRLSAIDGLLLGIKGNIAVAGWPWAGGLRSRQHVLAENDAAIISTLRAAGAILIGQTTMDAGALGASGRSIEGPIRHPLDPTLSVGGSSGGSAAAVAAYHCDIALGSDTIGSVRIPAALCGIYGFKPSTSRLSLQGVLPVHEHFDHLGPLSRDLPLTRALLQVLGALNRTPPVTKVRCAALCTFGDVKVDSTVESAFRAALATFEHPDLSITTLDWPADAMGGLELRKIRRAIFALCEHRMWLAHREHLERRPEDFDEPLRSMLEFGSKLEASKLAQYRKLVDEFAARWRQTTREFDAVLLPTSPVPAFAHASATPDSLADLTVIATATGSPAASIPIPSARLPVGLQIVGRAGTDELVIALAERLSLAAQISA